MQDYGEIFEQRGSSYDRAMRAYPRARDAEFAQALAPLELRAGMKIGDVPAGGGYLRGYLPTDCQWLGHEPSSGFAGHAGGAVSRPDPLLPLPWPDDTLDGVVSLAGVHHIEDKQRLFREIARVTRPGGRFVLSDVAESSPPALFLDGFVGTWNSTGHEGSFLNDATHEELTGAGWGIVSSRINPFLWTFAKRAALVDFTRQLFDICRATPDMVEAAVADTLGIVPLASEEVGMNWSLMTITCAKPVAG